MAKHFHSETNRILWNVVQVHQFAVGNAVQIQEDVKQVKDYQKGHGEWTDNMHMVSPCVVCLSLRGLMLSLCGH